MARLPVEFKQRNPRYGRAGAQHRSHHDRDAGELCLAVWGRSVRLAQPGFAAKAAETGEPLEAFTTLLLAYYFARADGSPESGNRIAFSELPNAFPAWTAAVAPGTDSPREWVVYIDELRVNAKPAQLSDPGGSRKGARNAGLW